MSHHQQALDKFKNIPRIQKPRSLTTHSNYPQNNAINQSFDVNSIIHNSNNNLPVKYQKNNQSFEIGASENNFQDGIPNSTKANRKYRIKVNKNKQVPEDFFNQAQKMKIKKQRSQTQHYNSGNTSMLDNTQIFKNCPEFSDHNIISQNISKNQTDKVSNFYNIQKFQQDQISSLNNSIQKDHNIYHSIDSENITLDPKLGETPRFKNSFARATSGRKSNMFKKCSSQKEKKNELSVKEDDLNQLQSSQSHDELAFSFQNQIKQNQQQNKPKNSSEKTIKEQKNLNQYKEQNKKMMEKAQSKDSTTFANEILGNEFIDQGINIAKNIAKKRPISVNTVRRKLKAQNNSNADLIEKTSLSQPTQQNEDLSINKAKDFTFNQDAFSQIQKTIQKQQLKMEESYNHSLLKHKFVKKRQDTHQDSSNFYNPNHNNNKFSSVQTSAIMSKEKPKININSSIFQKDFFKQFQSQNSQVQSIVTLQKKQQQQSQLPPVAIPNIQKRKLSEPNQNNYSYSSHHRNNTSTLINQSLDGTQIDTSILSLKPEKIYHTNNMIKNNNNNNSNNNKAYIAGNYNSFANTSSNQVLQMQSEFDKENLNLDNVQQASYLNNVPMKNSKPQLRRFVRAVPSTSIQGTQKNKEIMNNTMQRKRCQSNHCQRNNDIDIKKQQFSHDLNRSLHMDMDQVPVYEDNCDEDDFIGSNKALQMNINDVFIKKSSDFSKKNQVNKNIDPFQYTSKLVKVNGTFKNLQFNKML